VQLGANVLVSPERAGTELPAAVDGQRRRWHAGPSWDRDAYGAGDAVERVRRALECCE
jgi:hypothetical protein